MKRIRERAEHFNEVSDKPFRLSFSMGSAIYDNNCIMNREQFIGLIDSLMYKDKAAKKSL